MNAVGKLKNLKLVFRVKISQFSALCIIDWACELAHKFRCVSIGNAWVIAPTQDGEKNDPCYDCSVSKVLVSL